MLVVPSRETIEQYFVCHSIYVFRFDLLHSRKCSLLSHMHVLLNAECILVRNLSVWETYLCWLISRSSLRSSPEDHISYSTTVWKPDKLHNVIVEWYVTFYQINRFFVIYYFFIIDQISSWAEFGPRAIVWRPWSSLTPVILYILGKRCYAYSNQNHLLKHWHNNSEGARGP